MCNFLALVYKYFNIQVFYVFNTGTKVNMEGLTHISCLHIVFASGECSDKPWMKFHPIQHYRSSPGGNICTGTNSLTSISLSTNMRADNLLVVNQKLQVVNQKLVTHSRGILSDHVQLYWLLWRYVRSKPPSVFTVFSLISLQYYTVEACNQPHVFSLIPWLEACN